MSATAANRVAGTGGALAADSERARKALVALAAVLTLLLALLMIALFYVLPGVQVPTYAPVAGIRALRVLYGPGVGDKPFFDGPMGAAFGRDGRIYVADTGNHRIVVFDRDGNYLRQWGGLGIAKAGERATWRPGLFNYPTDVAVDDEDQVYVADFNNNQIQVFDSEGSYLRAFPDPDKRVGRGGSGQGGTGIAVTSLYAFEGRAYATDRYQVLQFSTDGELLAQFGKPGRAAGEFDHPNGITVSFNAVIVVSDFGNSRVMALGPSGETIWVLGQPLGSELSTAPVDVEGPRGLVAAEDGRLFVADALAQRILEISPSGELMKTYGSRGAAPGQLNFPTDVDARGDRLVIAEKGGNRVQIVELIGR